MRTSRAERDTVDAGPGLTPDTELVARFQEGDESAFNEIVHRYSNKVMSLCTYTLKDSEEALDVSQDVFVKIHRALPRFRGDSKLSTWIHTITLNACKNRISSLRRLMARRKTWNEDPLTHTTPPGPDSSAESQEVQRIIHEEMGRLPEKFRVMIVLKDVQNISYEDIGQILGLNPGTVKSRLHRAREALSARLRARGVTPSP